jgi:uncharacterized protein YdcH (DUF465 family)
MHIDNHSLAREFPKYKQQIHDMKMSDRHFARLFADYDDVEHEVHRIESGAEVSSDEYIEGLKKKRLKLKDELYSMLKACEA